MTPTELGDAANLSIQLRGHDPITVALSLVRNRASKIALLRADGTERCDAIADRFQASLDADVEAFIAKRKCVPLAASLLREAAHA